MKKYIFLKKMILYFLIVAFISIVILFPCRRPRLLVDVKPHVFTVLSEDEVRSLRAEIEMHVLFKRSQVVGDDTVSEVRTSYSGFLPFASNEARKLRAVAAKKCGVSESCCESSLHIAKYSQDQYYRPHQDACCDESRACTVFKKFGGNRIGTLLVYLTDDFEGGSTSFPNIPASFRPRAGDAVFWRYDECPPWALHSGQPVTSGHKMIATVWIREKKV